ncbi:MAG: hypothetical protein HN742_02310 [Lentisphaerae bacterium]|jgi:hypothetical protein|nr:hypothetical protein [Lentisphaerota bacterium]MBT4818281.1 hypothetical protein [Lentisphaerota bacterium]MBT5612102.1 hypothetical protein [Lentisphaerota bacterium]MBT7060564.1 hypothetical protein [Lentisphaerota bacterium]MBT7840671.1 hypothetical protein [Lentisphaerota bacterium]
MCKPPLSRHRLFWTGLALVFLPLLGVRIAGRPAHTYLEFPPLTQYVSHAPFSWPVFSLIAGLALITLGLLGAGALRGAGRELDTGCRWGRLPRWGVAGIAFLTLAWVIAWTRLPSLAAVQCHTFVPLWLSYIVVVSALTHARKGTCLLTRNTLRYAALFPASAVLWWYFEYLNRFVQNWHYVNVSDFTRTEYGVFATLSFSTVLPAVVSTVEFLRTFSPLEYGFCTRRGWSPRHPRLLGLFAIVVGGAVLATMGAHPDPFFAVLWLGPLLIWWGGRVVAEQDTILPSLAKGDWRPLALPALAALLCGFVWELWNLGSLARWEYSVPYVQRFHLFAMPVLGYIGYLPFGMECMVVADEVMQAGRKSSEPRPAVSWNTVVILGLSALAALAAVAMVPRAWCTSQAAKLWNDDSHRQHQLAEGVHEWAGDPALGDALRTGSSLFDGEWLFGTHMTTAMGLAQVIECHPELSDALVPRLATAFSGMRRQDTRAFDAKVWNADPLETLDDPDRHHAAYLGYFNLALGLGLRAASEGDSDLPQAAHWDALHDAISAALERRIEAHDCPLLDTYPGEMYPVDNCAVIGSLAIHARLRGLDRTSLLENWEREFRRTCIDPATGLMWQALDPEHRNPADRPRGSGTTLGLYLVAPAFPDLSRDLFQAVKRELTDRWLGFALVREYARGVSGRGDIDSGPLVFGYSVSATGFSLAGARLCGDRRLFTALGATAWLAGAPRVTETTFHWTTGGPIGDAILFAMSTAPRAGERPADNPVSTAGKHRHSGENRP